MSTRENYIEKMKLQLDALNEKMNSLEAQTKEVKKDALHAYQNEVHKLQQESKLAAGKLDELRTATEETWESMVTEMEKIRDAFTHSFHYFKSQL